MEEKSAGKSTFPYGRTRQDSVAQPFTKLDIAEKVAEIGERMTGEMHHVVSRSHSWHIVLRTSDDGKVFRA